MARLDLAMEQIQREFIETMTVARRTYASLLNYKGTADSFKLPYRGSRFTIYTGKSGAASATGWSHDVFHTDIEMFGNQYLDKRDEIQLLGGNGAHRTETVSGLRSDLDHSIDVRLRDYTIGQVSGVSVDHHHNLAAATVTDDMVNSVEGMMRETDGITDTQSLFWIGNPRALAHLKSVSDWVPNDKSSDGVLGIPQIASINGIPVFSHNAMPGQTLSSRYGVATTAVSITSNVATATVASNHGFVAGQKIWTSGLTANVASTAPVAITSVTSTTIVYPQNGADGAMADGVGTIYTGSSMVFLVYPPWFCWSTGLAIPELRVVDLETDAGSNLQAYQLMGRGAHAGCVKVLHVPAV